MMDDGSDICPSPKALGKCYAGLSGSLMGPSSALPFLKDSRQTRIVREWLGADRIRVQP